MKTQNNLPLEKMRILDICQRIYKHAEEIYQYLSGLHKEERAVARLFGELAVDKCNHADAFKMASKLRGRGVSGIMLTEERATDVLDKVTSVQKWVHHHPVSLVHALRFSLRMEENLEAVHIQKVLKFERGQDMAFLSSSVKTSADILHTVTEEHLNLTLFGQENEDLFD